MSIDDTREPGTPPTGDRLPLHHITRRSFLGWAGAATATGLYIAEMPAPVRWQLAKASKPNPYILPDPGLPTRTLELRRPDDFVALRFVFYNLDVDTTDSAHPMLVPKDTTKATYTVVSFPG